MEKKKCTLQKIKTKIYQDIDFSKPPLNTENKRTRGQRTKERYGMSWCLAFSILIYFILNDPCDLTSVSES